MWKSDEGRNVSYWQASQDGLETAALSDSAEADVCIIGGGIAGLTTAYLLTRSGKQVVVIDDGIGFPKGFGGGIGLSNTRARLTALYGSDGRLSLEANAQGGVVAGIEFPFEIPATARAAA